MDRRLSMVALVVAFVLAAASRSSLAQEPVKPSPEHAVLQQLVGTWEATTKTPDGQEFQGTSNMQSTCGGLWIASDFRGDFGGQKFEGRGLDGYDTDKKKYVSVWVDSMSTAPMLMEGDYDKATKTLTTTGTGKGPDGKPTKYKSVTTIKDKDHHTSKLLIVAPDGSENPMLTIEYRRKK